jgi:preprotein translocase subunit YajC
MNEEQIKQVAQSTEQAVVDVTQRQLAENVNKLRNKQSSFNNINLAVLTAGIVFIIVMGLFSYFIVAATNNSKQAVIAQVSEVKAGQSVIAANVSGLNETIENGNADIISSIDGVQSSVDKVQSSVAAVEEQNVKIAEQNKVIQSQNRAIQKSQTKVLNKVKTLKEALDAANATKLASYSECLSRSVIYITFTNADDSLSVKQSKCKFLLD